MLAPAWGKTTTQKHKKSPLKNGTNPSGADCGKKKRKMSGKPDSKGITAIFVIVDNFFLLNLFKHKKTAIADGFFKLNGFNCK